MKKVLLTALAALSLTAGAVAAQDLQFYAEAEYGIEAEVFETELGFDYTVERFTFTPELTASDRSGNLDFDSFEFTVSYEATESMDVYVRVETDDSFDYNETVFGARFNF